MCLSKSTGFILHVEIIYINTIFTNDKIGDRNSDGYHFNTIIFRLNLKMRFQHNANGILRFIATQFFLCYCVSSGIFAQSPLKGSLSGKAYELVCSDPNEAIKIGEHLLKNSHTNAEKTDYNLLIAKSYLTKGNYNNALQYVFEAGKNEKSVADSTKIAILLLKSELLKGLYLDSQAKQYSDDAVEIINFLKPSGAREKMRTHVLLAQLRFKIDRQDNDKALDLLYKREKSVKKTLSDAGLQQNFNIIKGQIFNRLSRLDSAKYFLQKALSQADQSKSKNTVQRITILNELGRWYFQNKQYQKATELLLESKNLAKKLNNDVLLKNINRNLAVNYLGLNDKANYKFYNNEFLNLNNELEESEQESVNTAFNLISKEQETTFEQQVQRRASYLYNTLIAVSAITIVLFLFWMKSRMRKKRLREIINYLEISRNIFTKPVVEKKETNKKSLIPIETEQAILAKLKRFEASTKYTNNEMSLAVLAAQFDTNTKYLSEIINKQYGDNFNAYINKLRIGYIIQKLKTDPNFIHYKISYLAEHCGFSSHSGFATVFKSITGIAPVTFIDLLKEEMETENEPIL